MKRWVYTVGWNGEKALYAYQQKGDYYVKKVGSIYPLCFYQKFAWVYLLVVPLHTAATYNSVRFATIRNHSLKSATSCVAISVSLDHIAVCVILSWLKALDLAKSISNAYWMANGRPSVVHIPIKLHFSGKRKIMGKPHSISYDKTAKIKRKHRQFTTVTSKSMSITTMDNIRNEN